MRTRTRSVAPSVGFTLIEVVCALAILIFLFAGIYGIANGALTLSRASNEGRTQELRLNNFDGMLRSAFEDLPPSTQFELASGEQGIQLTLISEVGRSPFTWNQQAAMADRVVLRIEADSAAKGQQRFVVEHWGTSAAGRVESIGELQLLSGLKGARWRLFDAQENRWEESWAMQKGRPLYAELSFEGRASADRQRLVFWIPSYMNQRATGGARNPAAP